MLNAEALSEITGNLSDKRKPVGLLIEDERGEFDRMWQTSRISEIELIDLIEELLVDILHRSDSVLGAFYEDDFHDWLAARLIGKESKKPVICAQLDAWLATCGRVKALEFFSNVTMREFVVPVLFVTAQHSLIMSSNFPSDQSWSVRELEAA